MRTGQNKQRISVLRTMIHLSIPTIIEQVLETVVQYVDTAMVGHLGEQATAAVSVTTTINWLIHSLMSAFGVGILAMTARAVGEKNKKLTGKLAVLTVWLVLILGAIEGTGAVLLSPYIPVWMGAAPGVREDAALFFTITSIPMIFRAGSVIFGAAVRASGDTKTPMVVNVFVNGINIVLNYWLIYTEGLGVLGAAAASAVSYTFGGISMFYIFKKKSVFSWRKEKRIPDMAVLRRCFRISIPVMMTNTASCLGQIMFTGLVSGMGTSVFAAHSIAVTAETIFYIPGYGMSTAVSAMVGYSIGERSREKFDVLWKQAVCLTMILMCAAGAVLYFVSDALMGIFTPSPQVVSLGAQMLRIVAVSEPFFGLMIIMQGIYNGLGKTGYAFFVETGSMWGIRILLSLLCVKVWQLGLGAVWYCMIADNITKAVLYMIRFLVPGKREKLWKQAFH